MAPIQPIPLDRRFTDWLKKHSMLTLAEDYLECVPLGPDAYDLQLEPSLKDVSDIPTKDKSRIIVAAVDNVLHFRIFDDNGEKVMDTDENQLKEKKPQIGEEIEDLRKQLGSLWPPHERTWCEKIQVITAVISIVDLTPSEPRSPYAHDFILGSRSSPQTDRAIELASTWVSIYPAAIIPEPGKKVLETLYGLVEPRPEFNGQSVLKKIGIQGVYMTPIFGSGGIKGIVEVKDKEGKDKTEGDFTKSIDGGFDPISIWVHPSFGDTVDYKRMAKIARNNGDIILIGNLVPLHTGQGPDFQLALRDHPEYRNVYMLVEIPKDQWQNPALWVEEPESNSQVPVPSKVVLIKEAMSLVESKCIPGLIHSCDANIMAREQSGWSATGPYECFDGKVRRWLYMHFFKSGQPVLNLDHPDCQALRLINGIAISKIRIHGARGLRIDAIPFSVETEAGATDEQGKPGTALWDSYTPSAIRKANQHASLIRQLGGFSFQELIAPLKEVKKFTEFGADLTYDFFTRAPYLHAILTGDTALLRLAFRSLLDAKIQPKSLVHDLQNHDELTYQLPDLEGAPDKPVTIDGQQIRGKWLQQHILMEMRAIAAGEKAPWNKLYRPQQDGVATTLAGFIAAALDIDLSKVVTGEQEIGEKDLNRIRRAHLLVAWANAMQPGVFCLSTWDLVGALPLPLGKVAKEHRNEGDWRWINRGGVDLMNVAPEAEKSDEPWNLPRAKAIYGPLLEQLNDSKSFVSQLKVMLTARARYKIALGELVSPLPPDESVQPGVCLLAMKLTEKSHEYAVTALNFARKGVTQELDFGKLFPGELEKVSGQLVIDAVTGNKVGTISDGSSGAAPKGYLMPAIFLEEIAGMTILIQKK